MKTKQKQDIDTENRVGAIRGEKMGSCREGQKNG